MNAVIESSEGLVGFLAVLAVFREGCKRHWWAFNITFGVRSPDQRLTKAEKNTAVPQGAEPATVAPIQRKAS